MQINYIFSGRKCSLRVKIQNGFYKRKCFKKTTKMLIYLKFEKILEQSIFTWKQTKLAVMHINMNEKSIWSVVGLKLARAYIKSQKHGLFFKNNLQRSPSIPHVNTGTYASSCDITVQKIAHQYHPDFKTFYLHIKKIVHSNN